MNAIECIIECIRYGALLSANGNDIDLWKPRTFPAHLLSDLAANKESIIHLLRQELVFVESELDPDHLMIWCRNNATRELLVNNGADPGVVWTLDELREIVKRSPDSQGVLSVILAKRHLKGRVK